MLLPIPDNLLYVMGGKVAANIAGGEYFRLITSIFLHSSLVHLLLDMQFLLLYSSMSDPDGGEKYIFTESQYAVIYTVAGVYGNIVSVLFDPYTLNCGSIGAMSGIIGAQVKYQSNTSITTVNECNPFCFFMHFSFFFSRVEATQKNWRVADAVGRNDFKIP